MIRIIFISVIVQPSIIWVNWYRNTSINFVQKYHIFAAGKIKCAWVQNMISRSLLVVLVWHPIKFYEGYLLREFPSIYTIMRIFIV